MKVLEKMFNNLKITKVNTIAINEGDIEWTQYKNQ